MRTVCSDCHIPKAFGPEPARKLFAVKDIYAHLVGTIDSQEEYEARRLEIAETVWKYMRRSDSGECRSYDSLASMNPKAKPVLLTYLEWIC